MVDRLAALLERFPVSAQLFNAGALCGINLLDADGVHGQLHLVRRGPLEVSHGGAPVRIDEPSLLLYPRPLSHRFSSDPEQGADMACANLRFEGGTGNPVAAALPSFVCLPLSALDGCQPVLDLLFEEAFERRCGRQAMIDRLFEVVMIQLLRHLMERGEVAGGLLLFWNRTALLGALISAMAMAQVFLLNMTYDVPVKVLSSHLLLVSLFLVAPHIGRLANVLVLQRPAEPLTSPALFQSTRADRAASAVVTLLAVWVTTGIVVEGWSAWREYGDGRPKPELYGIWAVTEFTADGVSRPPLTTDQTRWQRVVFDEPGVITYQLMDGELVQAPAGEMAVRFERLGPDRLRAVGDLDGSHVMMSLQQVDLDTFTLRSGGFHWVQDYPHFA